MATMVWQTMTVSTHKSYKQRLQESYPCFPCYTLWKVTKASMEVVPSQVNLATLNIK